MHPYLKAVVFACLLIALPGHVIWSYLLFGWPGPIFVMLFLVVVIGGLIYPHVKAMGWRKMWQHLMHYERPKKNGTDSRYSRLYSWIQRRRLTS